MKKNSQVIPHRVKVTPEFYKEKMITTVYLGPSLVSLIERFTKEDYNLRFEIKSIDHRLLMVFEDYLFSNFRKESLRGEQPILFFKGEINNFHSVLHTIYSHIIRTKLDEAFREQLESVHSEEELTQILWMETNSLEELVNQGERLAKPLLESTLLKTFVQLKYKNEWTNMPFDKRRLAAVDGFEGIEYEEMWNFLNELTFSYTINQGKVEAISQHYENEKRKKDKNPIANVMTASASQVEGEWCIDLSPQLRTFKTQVYTSKGKIPNKIQNRSLFIKWKKDHCNYSVVTLKEENNAYIPKHASTGNIIQLKNKDLLKNWSKAPRDYFDGEPELKLVLQKEERSFANVKPGLSLPDRYMMVQLVADSVTGLDYILHEISEWTVKKKTTYKTDQWPLSTKEEAKTLRIGVISTEETLKNHFFDWIGAGERPIYYINSKGEKKERKPLFPKGEGTRVEPIGDNAFEFFNAQDQKTLRLEFEYDDQALHLTEEIDDRMKRIDEINTYLSNKDWEAAILQIGDLRDKGDKDPKVLLREIFYANNVATQFFHPEGKHSEKIDIEPLESRAPSILRDVFTRMGMVNNIYFNLLPEMEKDRSVYVSIERAVKVKNEEQKYYIFVSQFKEGEFKYSSSGFEGFFSIRELFKQEKRMTPFTINQTRMFIQYLHNQIEEGHYLTLPRDYKWLTELEGEKVVYYRSSKESGFTYVQDGNPSKGLVAYQHKNKLFYQYPSPNTVQNTVKEASKRKINQLFSNRIPISYKFNGEPNKEYGDYLYRLAFAIPTYNRNDEATTYPLPIHTHKYLRELVKN